MAASAIFGSEAVESEPVQTTWGDVAVGGSDEAHEDDDFEDEELDEGELNRLARFWGEGAD